MDGSVDLSGLFVWVFFQEVCELDSFETVEEEFPEREVEVEFYSVDEFRELGLVYWGREGAGHVCVELVEGFV